MSTSTVSSLVLTIPPPLTEHPASVYLSSLSPGSEPTMKRSLNLVAQLLTFPPELRGGDRFMCRSLKLV
ncbi:hypothetical protein [Nostoc sp.]|uniref:hypothetical protein n=1 Tax=Nostoc sp. TaxID=1180 RepID=UPI002FF8D077